MIELLIGAVVAAGVSRYIIKGYSATGVLMVGGLLLLGISALMGKTLLPSGSASTGWRATDMIEYVKILLMSRGGDLGMMIMMLCGFAAYMTHIGANDVVVKLASRPLQMINSPYLLMVAAYFVACLMSLAVSSATGLGVLLMATLFPLMVNVGISRGAAAAIALRRRRYSGADLWRRGVGGQGGGDAAGGLRVQNHAADLDCRHRLHGRGALSGSAISTKEQ